MAGKPGLGAVEIVVVETDWTSAQGMMAEPAGVQGPAVVDLQTAGFVGALQDSTQIDH